MADEVAYQTAAPATLPAGLIPSAEEVTTINGVTVTAQHAQRVILAMRTANATADDITSGEPLPTDDAATRAVIGATMEAVASSDTAASGLNGLLKRALQHLTTLIGRLPATLGQKTKANSLAVTYASDQEGLPEPASDTTAVTNVTATTSVATLLALNTNRQKYSVFNDSAATLWLKAGSGASSTSFSAELAPGGYFETPIRYRGVVTGMWTAADGGAARVTEYT